MVKTQNSLQTENTAETKRHFVEIFMYIKRVFDNMLKTKNRPSQKNLLGKIIGKWEFKERRS